MTVPKCIIDMLETRTIIRTIEAQIVQKLENNEARPKFTGSYKKSVYLKKIIITMCLMISSACTSFAVGFYFFVLKNMY